MLSSKKVSAITMSGDSLDNIAIRSNLLFTILRAFRQMYDNDLEWSLTIVEIEISKIADSDKL